MMQKNKILKTVGQLMSENSEFNSEIENALNSLTLRWEFQVNANTALNLVEQAFLSYISTRVPDYDDEYFMSIFPSTLVFSLNSVVGNMLNKLVLYSQNQLFIQSIQGYAGVTNTTTSQTATGAENTTNQTTLTTQPIVNYNVDSTVRPFTTNVPQAEGSTTFSNTAQNYKDVGTTIDKFLAENEKIYLQLQQEIDKVFKGWWITSYNPFTEEQEWF